MCFSSRKYWEMLQSNTTLRELSLSDNNMGQLGDRETGIVEITSPDTDRFSLDIDTSKLDEYSPTHQPAANVRRARGCVPRRSRVQGAIAAPIGCEWMERAPVVSLLSDAITGASDSFHSGRCQTTSGG